MKLHYKGLRTANSITLKRAAGNVFYQKGSNLLRSFQNFIPRVSVATIDDVESLELWITDEIGSVEVESIQLVDIESV